MRKKSIIKIFDKELNNYNYINMINDFIHIKKIHIINNSKNEINNYIKNQIGKCLYNEKYPLRKVKTNDTIEQYNNNIYNENKKDNYNNKIIIDKNGKNNGINNNNMNTNILNKNNKNIDGNNQW